MFLSEFQDFIKKHELFSSKSKILLAISGGMDSMVMLDFFLKSDYNFGIAHVNFHLRDDDSNKDQEFVKKMAEKYQIPFYTIDFNTIAYSNKHGISIEMAARNLRYEWFEKIRFQNGYKYIATAHHANDVVETFHLNLFRASGIKGLSGIKVKNNKIVRPILFLKKTDIEKIAKDENIEFRTDYTNSDTDIARNKIRHNIIPELETINESYTSQVLKTIEYLKQSQYFINEQINAILLKIKTEKLDYSKFDLSDYQNNKNLGFILHEILHPYHFNSAQIIQISANVQNTEYSHFKSDIYEIYIGNKELLLKALIIDKWNNVKINNEVGLSEYFDIEYKSFTLKSIKLLRKNTIAVTKNSLEFPLIIRKLKVGDYFYPLGMKGKKSISDFLIDTKLNPFEKQKVRLLINSKDEIIWVIGYRLDNRLKVNDFSENLLSIKTKKT